MLHRGKWWAKAIKRRADFLASGAGASENQTDQVDQPSLLHSPLRIFVYDASEREMDGNRGKKGQRKRAGHLMLLCLGWVCRKKLSWWLSRAGCKWRFVFDSSTFRLEWISIKMKCPAKKNHLQPWSVHKTGPEAFTNFAGICSNHSSLRHRRYLGFAAGEMERLAGMVKVRADKHLQWLKSPWKRVYELWAYDFQYMIYIYT